MEGPQEMTNVARRSAAGTVPFNSKLKRRETRGRNTHARQGASAGQNTAGDMASHLTRGVGLSIGENQHRWRQASAANSAREPLAQAWRGIRPRWRARNGIKRAVADGV